MDEKNKEFVAPKTWDLWQKGVFAGVIVVMITAAVVLRTIWWMVAFLFVLAALSLYYMKNTFKAEYAYTISQKMNVEILKSGGSRVKVCEFFLQDAVLCGKYTKEAKTKLTNADKTYNAASDVNDEDETYFILFEREGNSNAVLFTPDDMMLKEMKKHMQCSIE